MTGLGDQTVPIHRQNGLTCRVLRILLAAIAGAAFAVSAVPASAQGLFEFVLPARQSLGPGLFQPECRFRPERRTPRTASRDGRRGRLLRADLRRALFPDPAHGRREPGAAMQLVLSGEPDQDLQRQQHRPRGRGGRQALFRAEHGLRLSREDRPGLHLQRQGRLRPRHPAGAERPDAATGRHRRDQQRPDGLRRQRRRTKQQCAVHADRLAAALRRVAAKARRHQGRFRRTPHPRRCGSARRTRATARPWSAMAATSAFRLPDRPPPPPRSTARR